MDKRIRSPNYPALSLPDAIDKVASVYRALHTHAGPREVVAKAMGYTGLNGASATAVSALSKYGLLERNGDEVGVSERALRILHPHSPAERAQAMQEAAWEPALFMELKERFPGRLPNEDLLRNYLVRKGFAPAALGAVISAYRETVDVVEREMAGRPGASSEDDAPIADQSDRVPPAPAPPSSPIVSMQETGISALERSVGRWDFEGGGYVRVVAAGDVDTDEVLDMVETLIALKRQELERAKRRTNATSPPGNVTEENTFPTS